MSTNQAVIVRANRACCVVGCGNTEVKNPELKFYCFPGRNYEMQRKELWIKAINRIDSNGQPWTPKPHSRVCSAHFVGGKKSQEERSESYVPSIFPKVIPMQKAQTTLAQFIEEFSESVSEDFKCDMQLPEIITIKPNALLMGNASQLNYCNLTTSNDNPEATVAPVAAELAKDETENQRQKRPKKADKSCGPRLKKKEHFFGYRSAPTNETLQPLTGVSREFFKTLLALIESPPHKQQPSYYRSMRKEDKLLLFLMKMKMGVSFRCLAYIFNIPKFLASKMYFKVLRILSDKTQTWAFWPYKESMRNGSNDVALTRYNYRCAINCVEVPIDKPSRKRKNLLTTNCNGCFTKKFLVLVTPNGYICRVSKGYCGNTSDDYIVKTSGFLNFIEAGDSVLAMKPFKKTKLQLSKRGSELVNSNSARMSKLAHVDNEAAAKVAAITQEFENAFRRLRSLKILSKLKSKLLLNADVIMQMCSIIANSPKYKLNVK